MNNVLASVTVGTRDAFNFASATKVTRRRWWASFTLQFVARILPLGATLINVSLSAQLPLE